MPGPGGGDSATLFSFDGISGTLLFAACRSGKSLPGLPFASPHSTPGGEHHPSTARPRGDFRADARYIRPPRVDFALSLSTSVLCSTSLRSATSHKKGGH